MERKCEVRYGDTPKIRKLSGVLGRPVIVFDIEHSGYVDGVVGVTEFAAIKFDTNGELEVVNTLVNPGDIKFNPHAMRISRLSLRLLRHAPQYRERAGKFVMENQHALWVGYNSNSSDLPILKKEHERLGVGAPLFEHRLDVLKLNSSLKTIKGSLSKVVEQVDPQFVLNAHVAMADVSMTVFLLEHLLSCSTRRQLMDFGLLPKAKDV